MREEWFRGGSGSVKRELSNFALIAFSSSSGFARIGVCKEGSQEDEDPCYDEKHLLSLHINLVIVQVRKPTIVLKDIIRREIVT
jgi:hypothetical protein